jgi:hypothetical protein
MNTTSNARNTIVNRPSRRTVVRVGIAVAAASFATVGATSPATATFRDPGPGSIREVVEQSMKQTPIDSGVVFPYVSSPCFAGRTPDRWATDVGAQTRCVHIYGAPDTYTSAGGPAVGPVAQMISINTYSEISAVWPFVAPEMPYPKRM